MSQSNLRSLLRNPLRIVAPLSLEAVGRRDASAAEGRGHRGADSHGRRWRPAAQLSPPPPSSSAEPQLQLAAEQRAAPSITAAHKRRPVCCWRCQNAAKMSFVLLRLLLLLLLSEFPAENLLLTWSSPHLSNFSCSSCAGTGRRSHLQPREEPGHRLNAAIAVATHADASSSAPPSA